MSGTEADIIPLPCERDINADTDTLATDELLALLFSEGYEAPEVGRAGYFLLRGPVLDLAERIGQVLRELMFSARGRDITPYVTAIHALALDLATVTGAPTNGRRSAGHAALVERFNAEWS